MRGGSKGKGILSYIVGLFISAFMIGAVVAFCKINNINDVSSFLAYARHETPAVKKCYEQRGKNCHTDIASDVHESANESATQIADDPQSAILTNRQLQYSGPAIGQPYLNDDIKRTKDSMTKKLDNLKTSASNIKAKKKYNASEWKHFIPSGKSCWSTQSYILTQQAIPGSVTFLDAYRNGTDRMSKACSIASGKWIDSYTGKKISNVKKVTLDYIIPLKYANAHGGANWSLQQKQDFANDSDNLATVTTSSKKTRNAKTPDDWMPDSNNSACVFAKEYVNILNKYSLSVSNADKTALSQSIIRCSK